MRLADSSAAREPEARALRQRVGSCAAEGDDAALDRRCARARCAIAAAHARRARASPRCADRRGRRSSRTARAAREASADLPKGAGSAEARPRRSLDSRTVPRAGCFGSALRSTSSEPRQSAVPARPAFDRHARDRRKRRALQAARARPRACAGCRSPSTVVAMDACQRPPSARPVSAGACDLAVAHPQVAGDVGHLERLLPVAQRHAAEVRHHRHHAPVEVLDRQEQGDLRLHRPGAGEVGEQRRRRTARAASPAACGSRGPRRSRSMPRAAKTASRRSALFISAFVNGDAADAAAARHRMQAPARRSEKSDSTPCSSGQPGAKKRSMPLAWPVARNTPCPSRYGKPLVGPVIDTFAVVTRPPRKAASSQRIAFGDSRPVCR